ncbi:MAG: ribosome maturation factor RimM [bacterium]|nr:ribosome maturation factor RimM [bacterium]
MDRMTQIGEIWGTHGIKGELKANPLTDDLELFEGLEQVWLWNGRDQSEAFEAQVEQIRPVKGHWLFRFLEIHDLNQAEGYKGMGIWVPDDWLKPLEEDEFFVHDLIGTQAFNLEGEELGEVVDFIETAGQLLYKVADVLGGEFFFPAVGEVLQEIDVEAGRITLDLAPGMRELNRPESNRNESK